MRLGIEWMMFLCLAIFMLYWRTSTISLKRTEETQVWRGGAWYTVIVLAGSLVTAKFMFLW